MADIRPIDANALFDALRDKEFQTFCPLDEVDDVIADAPTLDYAPVRHGEWIEFDDGFDDVTFECSLCKVVWWSDAGNKAYRYCPNCGAKMDGGKENG